MNNILGKILLLTFFIFLPSAVMATTKYCEYSIHTDTKTAYINEAVKIHFKTRQKIHNEVMFFDLIPLKSEDYSFVLLSEKRHEFSYHDAKKDFQYLIFPKKEGTINVRFDFRIRRASDDAVAQAYIGSRDNVKSIPTIKVHIAQPVITLKISPLPKKLDGVGNFNLQMSLDKTSSNSYDAINVTYTLTGTGYLNTNFEPLHDINKTTIFTGITDTRPQATPKGLKYKKIWKYAIVAKEDFVVPMVNFSYLNTNTKTISEEKIEAKNIIITPFNTKALLDAKESPVQKNYFILFTKYIYYILSFIAGLLVAKLIEILPKKISTKKESCCKNVIKANSAQALIKAIFPLISTLKLEKEVAHLEKIAYTKENGKAFEKIKKEIIKKLKN